MSKELEKDIQYSILQYLRLKKIFCWKNNTAGIYKKSTGSYIPSQSVGSPDIFALKDGTLYGIECKTSKGKVSDAQIDFLSRMEKAGGVPVIARSLDDIVKIL